MIPLTHLLLLFFLREREATSFLHSHGQCSAIGVHRTVWAISAAPLQIGLASKDERSELEVGREVRIDDSNKYLEGGARLHVVATGTQSVEVETERGIAQHRRTRRKRATVYSVEDAAISVTDERSES